MSVYDKLGREITVGADCMVHFSGKREWIRCTVRQIRPDDDYPVRVDDGDEDNSDLLTNDFTISSWVEPWRVKIRTTKTKKLSDLRGIAKGANVANDAAPQDPKRETVVEWLDHAVAYKDFARSVFQGPQPDPWYLPALLQTVPHDYGFTSIKWDQSETWAIVLHTSYCHKNAHGADCGQSDWTVTIRPTFTGPAIHVRTRNSRNTPSRIRRMCNDGVRTRIHDMFYAWLTSPFDVPIPEDYRG